MIVFAYLIISQRKVAFLPNRTTPVSLQTLADITKNQRQCWHNLGSAENEKSRAEDQDEN